MLARENTPERSRVGNASRAFMFPAKWKIWALSKYSEVYSEWWGKIKVGIMCFYKENLPLTNFLVICVKIMRKLC
jgi:hypothetical protein